MRWTTVPILCFAAPCFAQTGLVVQHHLQWREVDGSGNPVANPNGVLEPGESAQISLSFSFTPPVGTFLPLPPPLEPGWTVHSLAGLSAFHLNHSLGSWQNISIKSGWNGSAGTLQGSAIQHIALGQEALGADTSNPVQNIWQGIWTPANYLPGEASMSTVHHGLDPNSFAFLWMSMPGPPQSFQFGHASALVDQILIPVIPAPGSAALFVGALVMTCRRRRPASC